VDQLFKWLHVSGNLIWIGSIVAVAVLLTGSGPATSRGEAALGVYRRLAVPAFLVSFVAGAIRLALSWKLFLVHTHWMHAKLPVALGVIALHHVIGARARKMAQGTVPDAGPAGILGAALAALAVLAAYFAIFRFPA
jgi:putative membrane protein